MVRLCVTMVGACTLPPCKQYWIFFNGRHTLGDLQCDHTCNRGSNTLLIWLVKSCPYCKSSLVTDHLVCGAHKECKYCRSNEESKDTYILCHAFNSYTYYSCIRPKTIDTLFLISWATNNMTRPAGFYSRLYFSHPAGKKMHCEMFLLAKILATRPGFHI